MSIFGEDNDDEVKITFENLDSNTEDNEDAQDKSDPTEPLRAIREQIVNVIPNPLPAEEEELERQKKILASISQQLKKQTILMQKMDEDIESIQSRMNSITDQLQAIGFIKSEVEPLPSRIDRKLNKKGKLVDRTKNIDKKKSSSSINKVRKINSKKKRKN
jgi:DNA repair ATPase RecN